MQPGVLVGGKYRILRKLGEGGMGTVWLAKNEVTEREFAIKFLNPSAERSEGQLTRFFQEAKVAGKLRHPSVLEIFDAGTEPSLGAAPYLVMELLDGAGLDEAIRRAGALPLGLALEITLEICRALAMAHQKGIVHRDLKPSNVFLHRTGSGAVVPKVLDFGISKVLVEDATGRQVTGMTRTGAVLGSPLYMSPEQAAGDKKIDARSDVHALGVLLWECLTGRAPFVADTYGLLLVEIIQGERPILSNVVPSVPASVSRLVSRAIARNRDQRFADAGAMATEIERVLGELGHVPLLSARDGAERFFGLIEGTAELPVGGATRTTAALELPTPTDSKAARAGSAARESQELRAAIPQRRSPLMVLGVLGLGAVVVVVAVLLARSPEPPATGEASAPASGSVMASEPAASSGASAAPVIVPVVPSAPPSASLAPSAAPAADPKPPTLRPKQPVAKPVVKPPPSGAPVHHGVTSSGL